MARFDIDSILSNRNIDIPFDIDIYRRLLIVIKAWSRNLIDFILVNQPNIDHIISRYIMLGTSLCVVNYPLKAIISRSLL